MNKEMLQDEELDINFLEILYVLLRKWWIILIGGLVGAIVMMVVTTYMITPMYQSQAILYILSKSTSVTSFADIQIGSAVSEDLEIIATSKPVIDGAREKVKENTGKDFSRDEVKSMLDVSNVDDTRILNIIVTSENPEDACNIANAIAETTASQMAEIMKSDPPTTVEKAEVEPNPISPSLMKNTILGAFMAMFLICIALIVRYILNDNIKNEEQVKRYLGVPTLVTIPYIGEKDKAKLIEKEKSLRRKKTDK